MTSSKDNYAKVRTKAKRQKQAGKDIFIQRLYY